MSFPTTTKTTAGAFRGLPLFLSVGVLCCLTHNTIIQASDCEVHGVIYLESQHCVPGSAEGPTVRILIESAQHCPSAPNLFPTHVLVSNGFKINLDKDNSHIVTPKGGIIPLVTWNNKVIIPFLPLSEFEQSRGTSAASVLPVATSSVAHSTQEQPPALSDVPTLQLWHYRLHKPTKDLDSLESCRTPQGRLFNHSCPLNRRSRLFTLHHP